MASKKHHALARLRRVHEKWQVLYFLYFLLKFPLIQSFVDKLANLVPGFHRGICKTVLELRTTDSSIIISFSHIYLSHGSLKCSKLGQWKTNCIVSSQFSKCPLKWIIHNRMMENRINSIQKRTLKLVYEGPHDFTFQKWLVNEESVNSADTKTS